MTIDSDEVLAWAERWGDVKPTEEQVRLIRWALSLDVSGSMKPQQPFREGPGA